MVKRIGIDAGGSLIKLAIEETDRFTFKKYPIAQLEEAARWLAMISQQAEINLTGGKADFLKQKFFSNARIVKEFDAVCEGANFLIKKTGMKMDQRFLLVNIGTGTSWYVIDGENTERIMGSGIGGGTLMGLGALLSGKTEYSQLVEEAKVGNRGNVDLLVKDIYHPAQPPIEGNLTASNFAKVATGIAHTESDKLAALVNMIAETIVLLSIQAAELSQSTGVVYIGSTLIGNSKLRTILEEFSTKVGLAPYFLADGEYCGAIGSLIVS